MGVRADIEVVAVQLFTMNMLQHTTECVRAVGDRIGIGEPSWPKADTCRWVELSPKQRAHWRRHAMAMLDERI